MSSEATIGTIHGLTEISLDMIKNMSEVLTDIRKHGFSDKVTEIENLIKDIFNTQKSELIQSFNLTIQELLEKYKSLLVEYKQSVINVNPELLQLFIIDMSGSLLRVIDLDDSILRQLQKNVYNIALNIEEFLNKSELILVLVSNGEQIVLSVPLTVNANKLNNKILMSFPDSSEINRTNDYYRGFDITLLDGNNNIIDILTVYRSVFINTSLILTTSMVSNSATKTNSEINSFIFNKVDKILLSEKIIDDNFMHLKLNDYSLDDVGHSQLSPAQRDLTTNIYSIYNNTGDIIKSIISYRLGNIEYREPIN